MSRDTRQRGGNVRRFVSWRRRTSPASLIDLTSARRRGEPTPRYRAGAAAAFTRAEATPAKVARRSRAGLGERRGSDIPAWPRLASLQANGYRQPPGSERSPRGEYAIHEATRVSQRAPEYGATQGLQRPGRLDEGGPSSDPSGDTSGPIACPGTSANQMTGLAASALKAQPVRVTPLITGEDHLVTHSACSGARSPPDTRRPV